MLTADGITGCLVLVEVTTPVNEIDAFYTPARKNKYLVSAKLPDKFLVFLPWHESERYNTTDVHIWSINVHVEFQFFAYCFNVLQAFLVIRACTADPNLNSVFNECG